MNRLQTVCRYSGVAEQNGGRYTCVTEAHTVSGGYLQFPFYLNAQMFCCDFTPVERRRCQYASKMTQINALIG